MADRIAATTDPLELGVDIVSADPMAAPLLLVGVVLLAVTVGFVVVLTVGALLETMATPFD